MYVPQAYQEHRPEVLAKAIRDLHFAAVITAGADSYHATHMPMVMKHDAAGVMTLESHMARPNPHWQALAAPQRSLAIFQGPHAYVSPNWYETRREHGKTVPTWNYIAVHAQGPLDVIDDRDWLMVHLNDLVSANEAHRAEPWALADAPADYVARLAGAIVGIRLTVDKVEGAWKMDQRRPAGDRRGTIEALTASADHGDQAVADVMRALEAARETEGQQAP